MHILPINKSNGAHFFWLAFCSKRHSEPVNAQVNCLCRSHKCNPHAIWIVLVYTVQCIYILGSMERKIEIKSQFMCALLAMIVHWWYITTVPIRTCYMYVSKCYSNTGIFGSLARSRANQIYTEGDSSTVHGLWSISTMRLVKWHFFHRMMSYDCLAVMNAPIR